jgi:hypothetical protein
MVDRILEGLFGPAPSPAGVTPQVREMLPAINAMQPHYQPGARESDMVEDRRPVDAAEMAQQLQAMVNAPDLGMMERAFLEMQLEDAKRWQRDGIPPDKQYQFRPR